MWKIETLYNRDEEGVRRTPYLTRVILGRLRLHIFYRGDADPDAHDHAWDFWTFPLTPYVEEVVVQTEHPRGLDRYFRRVIQVVPALRLSFRPATHCHRLLGRAGRPSGVVVDNHWRVVPGKVITLIWTSGKKRSWGFLKNRDGQWCWTPWRDYVFGTGKDTPC